MSIKNIFVTVAFRLDEPKIVEALEAVERPTAWRNQEKLAAKYSPEHYIGVFFISPFGESNDWEPAEILNYFLANMFGSCEKITVAPYSPIRGTNQKSAQEEFKEASITKITSLMKELKAEGLNPVDVIHLAVEEYETGNG